MGYILKFLLSAVMQMLAKLGDNLGNSMLKLLTIDIGTEQGSLFDVVFNSIIPIANVLQYFALALLLLMSVWSLIKTITTPEGTGETPLQIVFTTLIAGILIFFGPTLIRVFENLFNKFYSFILQMNIDGAAIDPQTQFDAIFSGAISTFDATDATELAATGGMSAITAQGDFSITSLLIGLIFSLLIMYEFVMFILEAVERYVVLGVLFYFSPLAFAMAGTKNTRNVFSSWCRMFASQMFLMITNVVFFRLFLQAQYAFATTYNKIFEMMGGASNAGLQTVSISVAATMLYFFMLYAILHVATKMDTYMATLGLSTAQTGRGLGQSMVMTAMGIGRALSAAKGLGNFAERTIGSTKPAMNAKEGVHNAFDNFGKRNFDTGDSMQYRPGSNGKIASAESMEGFFNGSLKGSAESQMDGSFGGNSLKTYLKETQDANSFSDRVIDKIDGSSFKAEFSDTGKLSSKGVGTFDYTDRATGESMRVQAVPIDNNGQTAGGLDLSDKAGRVVDFNGQRVHMSPVDAEMHPGLSAEFLSDNTGMKQFVEEVNNLPNTHMEQIQPGAYLRTQTDDNGVIQSQKLYTDPNIYNPTPDAHMSHQIGDRSYFISDTTSVGGSGSRTYTPPRPGDSSNYAQFMPKKEFFQPGAAGFDSESTIFKGAQRRANK